VAFRCWLVFGPFYVVASRVGIRDAISDGLFTTKDLRRVLLDLFFGNINGVVRGLTFQRVVGNSARH
jgi:hypothetical protein